jgi:CRISPR/Cas system-associated exonuclease Cas4 (RecB family)
MSSFNRKDLKSLYDSVVKREPRVHKPGKDRSIKPYLLGSPCIRKIYYNYTNTPEEKNSFPNSSARIGELGLAIGQMLADAFYKTGAGIKFRKEDGSFHTNKDGTPDYEFRVSSDELQIKLAKIDMVVILDDGLWLGEFKSMSGFNYAEARTPKPDHLVQGVTYLYLFNKALKEGKFAHIPELSGYTAAKGIKFLYYNKDKSDMREFAVTTTERTFMEIVTKIQEVIWYADHDQLPAATPDYCKSCPYQKRCEANKKASDEVPTI